MAYISAIGTRTTETHLGIEVGAIEIHLTAMLMDKIADLADASFKHPVR